VERVFWRISSNLPEVHQHCPGVPCLIVGTQVDMREDTSIKNEDEDEQDPNIPQKFHALKVFVTEHSRRDKTSRSPKTSAPKIETQKDVPVAALIPDSNAPQAEVVIG
jgi:hypothetical protein